VPNVCENPVCITISDGGHSIPLCTQPRAAAFRTLLSSATLQPTGAAGKFGAKAQPMDYVIDIESLHRATSDYVIDIPTGENKMQSAQGELGYDSLARIKKSAGKGGTAGRRQFEHFQGVSGLLSFMVVAKHYADIPDTGSSPIATLLDRGSLALHLFSALSGFSCFSSHPRLSVFSWRQVFGFYRSRLDRILLTMWFGYAVILLDDIKYKNFEKEWAHFWCEFTGHAYHVATLQDDQMLNNNCPNIPGWYVGSMIWMWLAFPLFAVMVRAVGKLRVWQFMGIVILVSFTWQLPGSLLYRFARWQVPDFNNHTMQMMYTASPLTFIASFILGILTASIAAEQADDRIEPYASKFSFFSEPHEERHIDDEHEPLLRGRGRKPLPPLIRLKGSLRSIGKQLKHYLRQRAVLRVVLADVAFAMCMMIAMFMDQDTYAALGGGLDLYSRGYFIPFFIFWIYGSSVQGGTGVFASLFSQPLLLGLGRYAMQVYLLQSPFAYFCEFIGYIPRHPGALPVLSLPEPSIGFNQRLGGLWFVVFATGLWLFAMAYSKFIEMPIIEWSYRVKIPKFRTAFGTARREQESPQRGELGVGAAHTSRLADHGSDDEVDMEDEEAPLLPSHGHQLRSINPGKKWSGSLGQWLEDRGVLRGQRHRVQMVGSSSA